ncbi:class I SAM-dependent methyltransferase [Tumebacillus permanentifrigoris]|uniref:Putative SAM-dependent methyltransferase n=1 Tax=Tumebacillus permanentifrigoris TaxID=378543 RepID=A0A316D3X2_9BACL|nr:class I SAM-dependent methyltransferase [Tumebacillus permanentifrigoris]PWK06600.1 putative SAM-dependent methyltransferase [Tumebacillus permanentifrigoris]
MTQSRNLIVTTGNKPTPAYVELAQSYAQELGVPYILRKKRGIDTLRADYGVDEVLVCTERVTLYVEDQEFFFHPSMANTRIKRLKSGENDIVIERAGVRPGDTVLDCTLGLGSDTIVFAHAVGAEGRVIGLESSAVIALLVRRGLQELSVDTQAVNTAMRHVEVLCVDHLDYLRAQPDNSVDVIYFDPMFRRTVERTQSIEPLRHLGDDRPLSEEAILEARRVARRRIVLKERWYSKEFARLGFHIPKKSTGSINYGVIDLEGGDGS